MRLSETFVSVCWFFLRMQALDYRDCVFVYVSTVPDPLEFQPQSHIKIQIHNKTNVGKISVLLTLSRIS